MSVTYRCDGCGKEAPGRRGAFKPDGWVEVKIEGDDESRYVHACSPFCVAPAVASDSATPESAA